MPKTPKKPPATALDMDLAEFARHADDALNRPTQLAEAVTGWRRGSTTINALGSRSEFRAQVNACADAVVGPEGFIHHGHLKIVRRHVDAHTQTKVLSDAVKRRSSELWLAARVPTTTMAIDGPVVALRAPVVRRGVTEVARALDHAKLHLGHAKAAVERWRPVLLDAAAGLRAETGWTGDPPYALNDGWVVGWREGLRFNGAQAIKLAHDFDVDPDEITELVRVPARTYYTVIAGPDDDVEEFSGDILAD